MRQGRASACHRASAVQSSGMHDGAAAIYGDELARIHHDHFGMVARAAARDLTRRLTAAGLGSGTIVDLAAGSGILSGHASRSGYDVLAVDISPAMLELARREAPRAELRQASLWSVDLPTCAGVAAVGEAFNYVADPAAGEAALEARLHTIHRALQPSGVLLFDIASPGRSGPTAARSSFWTQSSTCVALREREQSTPARLSREIDVFEPQGALYRRISECHVLELYRPEHVEAMLTRIGFNWERLARYDGFDFMPGWHGYAASKR